MKAEKNGFLAIVLSCAGGMAFAAAADVPSDFAWVERFVKYEGNPIVRPQGEWAADFLFNPAAIVRDGRVGLLCRGVNLNRPTTNGCWSVSNLIWAWSDDGFRFTLDAKPFLAPDATSPYKGGFEDPRLVYVPAERLYVLTYTGVKGKRADGSWETPGLIAWSKDLVQWEFGGETFPDRAVCITPCRINGRYWAYYDNRSLHTAWSEDLRHWHLTGRCVAPPRPGKFDEMLCEAVAAPVVSEQGILLLYNGAMGRQATVEYGRRIGASYREGHGTYQIGWILMDRHDPEKVIGRCENPVLSPTTPGELYGLVGYTLFASGLVEFNGRWFLYYGMADSRIGVATANEEWKEEVMMR